MNSDNAVACVVLNRPPAVIYLMHVGWRLHVELIQTPHPIGSEAKHEQPSHTSCILFHPHLSSTSMSLAEGLLASGTRTLELARACICLTIALRLWCCCCKVLMLLPEAGRHAAGALQKDEAAQILSGLVQAKNKHVCPALTSSSCPSENVMRSERTKVQFIADVERTADPLPESNGQQVSLI
jgi:hypothetical protein